MNFLTVEYLRRFIGTRYTWEGNNPVSGFDCSGLICEGLKFANLIKGHEDFSSHSLYQRYRDICKPEVAPYIPGTLLFFGQKLKVVHIAMASTPFHMIEAGGGNENTITEQAAAARNAFVRERPISNRTDFVAAFYPPYMEIKARTP